MADPSSGPPEPPDDVDAAFESIVAGFDAIPSLTPTDGSDGSDVGSDDPTDQHGGWDDLVPTEPTGSTGTTGNTEPADDPEDSFSPPPPPPLPRADGLTWLAWICAVGCPAVYLLLGALGWVWQDWQIGLVIAGFLGGFAVLVSRMRQDRSDDQGPDNGAVV
ncbi:MAG: hypothetical protein WAN48_02215 [Actinomycetes bacterium]